MIFPECKSRRKIEGTADDLEKLRHYIQMDAIRRSELELCLNAYEEIKRSREEVEEGLEKAHGFWFSFFLPQIFILLQFVSPK